MFGLNGMPFGIRCKTSGQSKGHCLENGGFPSVQAATTNIEDVKLILPRIAEKAALGGSRSIEDLLKRQSKVE